MIFFPSPMSNIEKISGIAKEGMEVVKKVQDIKQDFSKLKEMATTGIETGTSALLLKSKLEFAKHLPPELNRFLDQMNPLVKTFTSVKDLINGGEGKGSSLQELLNQKLYSKNVMKLLEDPASAVILLKFAQEQPTFLFRLFMEADGATDLENIPKGTTITVRNNSDMQQQLVGFLDQNATVAQILPDPTITGLKVKMAGSAEEKEFTRQATDNQFKAKDGTELKLAGVESMKVIAKDGAKDRKALWEQRQAQVAERITQKLNGDVPEASYVGTQPEIAAGKHVRDLYRKMPYREKLSAGGSFNAGCYKTAENLARHIGYDLHTREPAEKNHDNKNLEKYNMLDVIPDLLKDPSKKLVPGTVFWIKKDLTIFDPNSQSAAAGNHFFTYVGNINAGGREEPYFVDQFGFGNLARMNFSYPKRYFYRAFTPPLAS